MLSFPTLEIQPLPLSTSALKALTRSPQDGWWVFTSVNGVRAVQEHLTPDAPVHIACVGPRTAGAITELGLSVSLTAPVHHAAALADSLLERFQGARFQGKKPHVHLFQAREGRETLTKKLQTANVQVQVHKVYATEKPANCTAEHLRTVIASHVPTDIVLMSPSSVRHLSSCLDEANRTRLKNARLLSIGPATSAEIEKVWNQDYVEANPHRFEGILQLLFSDADPTSGIM